MSAIVNRAARDEAASALAACLRGEGDRWDLDERITHLRSGGDGAITHVRSTLLLLDSGLFGPTGLCVTREGYHQLRRTVAFLRSDLPYTPPDAPICLTLRDVALGLAALTALIAAASLWAMTGSAWWLLLPGATIGVPIAVWGAISARRDSSRAEPHPFFPFPDEATWQRYGSLLANDGLPPYDPAVHGAPRLSSRDCILAAPLGLPGLVLGITVLLPLAPLMALASRRPRGRQ